MQLIESIEKTKKFFNKTLHGLKSLHFDVYQKLPKPKSCNPFACGTKKMKDQYYTEFCNEWECDLQKAMQIKNSACIDNHMGSGYGNSTTATATGIMVVEKEQESMGSKREEKVKNMKSSYSRKREEEDRLKKIKKGDEGSYALARKMKELEMMDVSDVEHELDVEEALHYYSRLKSPVYLDIVDKFFTDMYTEFSVPQASTTATTTASITNSKRRFGSVRL